MDEVVVQIAMTSDAKEYLEAVEDDNELEDGETVEHIFYSQDCQRRIKQCFNDMMAVIEMPGGVNAKMLKVLEKAFAKIKLIGSDIGKHKQRCLTQYLKKDMENHPTKMVPNGPVLQPAEFIYSFWKRTPDTCDSFGMMCLFGYSAHQTHGHSLPPTTMLITVANATASASPTATHVTPQPIHVTHPPTKTMHAATCQHQHNGFGRGSARSRQCSNTLSGVSDHAGARSLPVMWQLNGRAPTTTMIQDDDVSMPHNRATSHAAHKHTHSTQEQHPQ
ncbi:uncharacterized protein LACBIDRAFT_328042 [Laccaria bicolor S238N-H82]|uniref:Predicted protein n=1 Tax=Laccaria bicolor (strain S238N-H82 / ATCC MYA-4686) TaxID=486041 RepID=B0DDK0_LACBS|nr:uncharacterized protein LACBIDRAFT_328042 [Laccaria bicolor S238N-H82]EDR07100.1 predicted protein [Laccaria bicolor S238N-H82]|eukprot:XP_001882031.1 predicted protein [Laccaria bicolor S238N-H82]